MISIKVVLVGATKCGKTCLAKRIAEDKDITSTPYVATVFDNYSKSLTIGGTPVIAGIWDTAGPEDYDRLRPLSYPATHLFIICADQSAPINTTDLTKWQKEYTLHIPNAQVAVVGCKSDLPDKSSAALQKWAAALPAKNFVGFYSVSAKTNDGIAAMLEGALTKCMATNQALLKERGGKPVSKAAPAPRSKAASKKKADSSDSEASEKPLKAKKESAAKDKAAGSDDEAAASKEEKAVDPNFTPSGKKAVLQVCLLGDKGVGKTSFALTAKSGVHMTRPTPPGGEVIEVHTTADDSFVETPCKVFLTDTDASSSYDRIRPFSYAGADAFIVLFSAVSPHSLKRAHTFWVPSIRETGTKAPIWLVGTKGDLREDVVTNEALANAGERPIEKKEAEKQSKAMKLKGYFEVNTLVAKDVRKALSEVIGAIWDAADDKKKAKPAAPKVKNADLEKQLLDLGNDLSEGRITFEQWEARVKEVSETEQANAEARHKARRLFNKVDADKSGTVDAEEFAALAQELGGGEAWSEEELADAFKQIDKDGSGAIDFEEFFAWLNAPATYAKSNAKLEALRAQATLRQVKAKSKAVATSLGAAARAAILAPPKSTKIDLKVSVGRDFTAASGIDISMLHDSHYADEVRSRVNAEFTDIVVSLGFGIRPDVDDFAVGEVSGLIREGILMAAKKAKFQIAEIRNQIVTIDGQRVFRVNFSFDSRIDPSLQDGIHAALIVRELAVAINFAEQPGKQTAKGAAGKFSVAVLGEVALSEDVLRSAMKIDPGSASGLRKGLVSSKDGSDADDSDESDNELAAEIADILGEKKGNPLLGLKILRSLETDLVFEDLAGLLPPGVQLFRMLKPLLLSSLVEAFGKPGSETLFAGFAHFDTLHSLTVCGGENALLLTTRNMTLFDLFPTMAEVARAKADSKGEDPFKVFMKAGESEKGDGSDSDSDGEDEAAADTERGANEYRGTDELQHLMAVSSDPKLISSLAKASIYDVYHKNTNWQVNADDDSQFGETLQLVADRGMKLYAKFDMQPGTYLPYLRVKLDGKVKAPKLKVKSKWVEGDDDKKCDDTVSADALKVLKDNKWHEVRLSVEPVTLSKPTSVKLKCASAVSTSWIKGVTVDWIGFKRLMPRPRIAQLRAQGVCTRDEDLQACYFFATAAEARRQYATSDCASEGVCGACADKCAPEGKKAVFYTDIAMFKCNCAAASCQCRATPLRKDSPSSVYPAVPKGYVLQANTLRRAVAAKVPAMAFADWPAPATGVTYFEVHVHDGGKANEIGVGLCEGARLGVNMFPGWRYHSFGFHGDNGLLYMGQGTEKSQKGHAEIEARPFGKGDTVGCGYDPEHKQVFFTLNGKLTPACFSEVPGEPQYFPVVTLLGLGATVEVNFGAQPFRYDVAQWAPRSAGDSLCTAIAFGL